ncbi:MAG: ferrous iron transport protein B, partial [Lentisphaeria bacterium]|nr:ferrous iron transport protein B [Lentisphaeria bacterium]
AAPMTAGIEWMFGWIQSLIERFWSPDVQPVLRSLLIDGVIHGVGGVIVFLPNILFLFLAIAFLEDTGYMARAAFVMDGIMRKFDLQGKSFVPLVLGFGCNVPAIMATRSIESERDRRTTILVLPLMSCGARLPIYVLLVPAFFAVKYHAFVMFLIYAIGVVFAMAAARLLKSTLFKGDGEVYLMELPPYRVPTAKSILLHMWDRGVMYLKKAGTIILGVSVLLFISNNFPEKQKYDVDYGAQIMAVAADTSLSPAEQAAAARRIENMKRAEEAEYTISGRVGKFLEPAFKPIGFDWRVTTAAIGALAAKEVFVSQLGILYAEGEVAEDAPDDEQESLRQQLRRAYTPLQGFCMMLFCLLSIPCLATLAIIRRELNSWKWMFLEAAGLFALAYVTTFIVYQIGLLLKIGTNYLA